MFAKEYYLTEDTGDIWRQTVSLTRNLLVEKAFQENYAIAVDQLMNKDRVMLLKGMV